MVKYIPCYYLYDVSISHFVAACLARDESKELVIRIIDTCPCIQVLPDGEPSA